MADHGHRDDAVAVAQTDAAHAGGAARFEDADVGGGEADGAAEGGDQHHVIGVGADGGVDEGDAVGQFHRDLAVALDIGEVGEVVLPCVAVGGGKDDLQVVPMVFGGVHGHQGGYGDARVYRQDVDDGLALGGAASQRQAPGFEFVDNAVGREEQKRRVGIGDKQGGDNVILFGGH